MTGEIRGRRNSSSQLLDELETLSQSLSSSTTARGRRANSLALPRDGDGDGDGDNFSPMVSSTGPTGKPRSRRLSMSPWRSRPNLNHNGNDLNHRIRVDEKSTSSAEKKGGIWNWKPFRAISHIGMHKLSCLFSVEVVAVQGLPASMNGLRLSVCVRKREAKDVVQTMPARVLQGAVDFEETLFLRCNVYSTGSGNHLKFESRPFLIYVSAIDAQELDFGRNTVDLSFLIQESITKNSQGSRIRQWDTSYSLYGKAKGGELVLKLGFQIIDKDGGQGIYAKAGQLKPANSLVFFSPFARKQSKSSFSVSSSRMTSQTEASTPSKAWSARTNSYHIDGLNLDEPEDKAEELHFPEFEVVDKGVEIEEKTYVDQGYSEQATDDRSDSSEVVKEVVPNQLHLTRLSELDSIAQQIKALKSMVGDKKSTKADGTDSERLDADEQNVTIEFLQLLEEEESSKKNLNYDDISSAKSEETESVLFVPDLGKGLGSVVQTKNGGYLAAANPFNTETSRNETPKLGIQLSKPLILGFQNSENGFETVQRISAIGIEELSCEVSHSMPIDDLVGKTAEQIAFEGIASAIIQGRNKSEGASSSAARTIEAGKTMAKALSFARKERISMGNWNIPEEPATLDEILVLAIQKIEAMAIEALKVQADIAQDVAPFDVSPLLVDKKERNCSFTAGIPLEDWLRSDSLIVQEGEKEDQPTVTLSVVVQLRDPMRRYEAVGGPLLVLIMATQTEYSPGKHNDEVKFKMVSLHVGGLKVWTAGNTHLWDAEKQQLTAMQWLVGNGFAKAGKKGKYLHAKGPDMLWSISSCVVADMWLKSIRNPDIKFPKQ